MLAISPFFVMPTVSALVWKNMMMHPSNGVLAWLSESIGLPAASAGTSPTLREVKRRLARRPEVDLSEASSAELRAIVRQAALGGISPLVV